MVAAISLIVPVYGVEAWLDSCLESIRVQTFSDFEVILVDDRSPDSCPQICDRWCERDTRFRVIHREKNGGLSEARNTGLREAEGRWICYVDSDDILMPRYLELLYQAVSVSAADVAIGQFACFRDGETMENAATADTCCRRGHTVSMSEAWERLSTVGRKSRGTSLIVAWNQMIRSNLAKKLPWESGRWHEDEFFVNQLLMEEPAIVEIDDVVYGYRQRPSGITGSDNRLDPRHLDLLDAFEERIRICRSRNRQRKLPKTTVRHMIAGYQGNMEILFRRVREGLELCEDRRVQAEWKLRLEDLYRRYRRSLYRYPRIMKPGSMIHLLRTAKEIRQYAADL